jgi:uncharacterized linocin/CFP29 family protein
MTSDDLGRGLVNWSADRWQALDKLATDTVTENVVLRNLVDHKDDTDAFSSRIGGKNVDVNTVSSTAFNFDMEQESDDDLNRKVRQAAQELAADEDKEVLSEMKILKIITPKADGYEAFSQAKGELSKAGVKSGFGTVVSSDIQVILETQIAGTKSGTEIVEQILSTKIAQSDALPEKLEDPAKKAKEDVSAIVLQASPPVYQLVNANSPRVRVLQTDGKKVKLQLEERIAVGELEPGRCVGIKKV